MLVVTQQVEHLNHHAPITQVRVFDLFAQADLMAKTGNSGKWKTPNQETKPIRGQGDNLHPGDVGVWVTCARHQESKAASELIVLFEEASESFSLVRL